MSSLARFAVLSDTHLAPPGTPDGMWNNITCLSVSHDLLGAAMADVASAGISQVVLLGDISDRGDLGTITAGLDAVTRAGTRALAVPGNHDVSVSPDALARAVERSAGSTLISQQRLDACPDIAVSGHGLRSGDGGQTCDAISLPDPGGTRARLLLWASHYPVLSLQERFGAARLRYPGDLRNLSHVAGRVARFNGPVLVLHGHLHAADVSNAGPVLQISVPAVVEWPHAWIETVIQVATGIVTVQTTLRSIPGAWPAPAAVTTLAEPIQNWTYTAGHWTEIPAHRPRTSP